jgi:hypothetical protein
VLIYAMLTMATMLAIGLTLSGLFISKLKLSGSARDSVAAIYIADSGVERCLYEARRSLPVGTMELPLEATLRIVDMSDGDEVTTDCTAADLVVTDGAFSFQSIGTFRSVQRSLEISQ